MEDCAVKGETVLWNYGKKSRLHAWVYFSFYVTWYWIISHHYFQFFNFDDLKHVCATFYNLFIFPYLNMNTLKKHFGYKSFGIVLVHGVLCGGIFFSLLSPFQNFTELSISPWISAHHHCKSSTNFVTFSLLRHIPAVLRSSNSYVLPYCLYLYW